MHCVARVPIVVSEAGEAAGKGHQPGSWGLRLPTQSCVYLEIISNDITLSWTLTTYLSAQVSFKFIQINFSFTMNIEYRYRYHTLVSKSHPQIQVAPCKIIVKYI